MHAVRVGGRSLRGQVGSGSEHYILIFGSPDAVFDDGRAQKKMPWSPLPDSLKVDDESAVDAFEAEADAFRAQFWFPIMSLRITARMCIAALRAARAPRRCVAPLRHIGPSAPSASGPRHIRAERYA